MEKIIRSLFFALLLAAGGGKLNANDSHHDTFAKANKAYEASRFTEAQSLYESLIRGGWESRGLYYNLGNVFYRTGHLGSARLWFERALALAPGDDDIRANLGFIRSQTTDKEEKLTAAETLARYKFFILWGFCTVNFFFFGFLILGIILEKTPEWLWWSRWIAGFVFCGGLVVAGILMREEKSAVGIVVEPRTEARTGPGADYQVGFLVPEAQKVLIFETSGDWIDIGVPTKGLKGWVKKSAVESINF